MDDVRLVIGVGASVFGGLSCVCEVSERFIGVGSLCKRGPLELSNRVCV